LVKGTDMTSTDTTPLESTKDALDPVSAGGPVVVGIDGSDSSREALAWAAFIAQSLGVDLEAVIAWEPLGHYSWGTAGWAAFPDDWNPAADAATVLEDAVVAAFGEHRPAGLTSSVREGTAARVLIHASAEASMLVVGSRGHGGFAGLLLGSVSAACSEHATAPVLVVHKHSVPPPPVH
jgi:nucleotide-binding universal stress UspA family protein